MRVHGRRRPGDAADGTDSGTVPDEVGIQFQLIPIRQRGDFWLSPLGFSLLGRRLSRAPRRVFIAQIASRRHGIQFANTMTYIGNGRFLPYGLPFLREHSVVIFTDCHLIRRIRTFQLFTATAGGI